MSGCHAGCRELVGEFAPGVHMRHRRRIWGATERLSRDEHRGRAAQLGRGPCQGVCGALAAPLVSLREALRSQKHQRPRFL